MKIKIAFSDFWKGFEPGDNWFYHFLNRYFDIELSDDPDVLIYSCYGHQYLRYQCTRVFYTAENRRPNFLECDYALSFDFNPRANHYRLPLYGIWDGLNAADLLAPKPPFNQWLEQKQKFCCMVVSNPNCEKRISFFKKLSEYKQVDSGGRYLNNVGGPVADKQQFISNYKFTLAFENESFPGYVTEKVFQPMFVYTLPVYWGSNNVAADFNTKSFINWHDYENDEEVIKRIIELDTNEAELQKVYEQPWFVNNTINEFINPELIAGFFKKIFETEIDPVAAGWKKWPALAMRKFNSAKTKTTRLLRF
jgi:alpha(1,3/1,4) fucosyltransferase